MRKNMRIRSLKKQNGAALVIGLLVLLVMTMLGISSMSRTTTGLKVASNVQTHNTAYQAAEAMLQYSLLETDVATGVDTGINWAEGGTQTVLNFDASGLGYAQSTATVTYTDCKNVPAGFSLTQAQSFKGVVHEVTAVGSATNAANVAISNSTQIVGVQTVRPGCPAVE